MKKIVINRCFGGFNLSHVALYEYLTKKYENSEVYFKAEEYYLKNYSMEKILNNGYLNYYVDGEYFSIYDIDREDPILVEIVERLGEKANSKNSKLKVVEIPEDVKYEISEYDGMEAVEEVHRTWC